MRKFIVNNKEILIEDSAIKKYYSLGQCFKQEGDKIKPVPGSIYLSQDGEICDCEDCTNILVNIVNEEGISLQNKINFSSLNGKEAFPYEHKLYFLDMIQEVS